MNYLISLVVLCVMILISERTRAQDQILLMNGHQFACKILSDTTIEIEYQIERGKKTITRATHKSDIFSYRKGSGPEIVLYQYDEILGDRYQVEEMRTYLAGEADARKNYTAWPTFIAGALICGSIAYVGQDGYLTAFVPPIIYTTIQFAPKIKIRKETISNPVHQYNEVYADGYEPPARSRKVIRAMQGAFGGSALGVGLWFLIGRK
jgi:hypothetical protein